MAAIRATFVVVVALMVACHRGESCEQEEVRSGFTAPSTSQGACGGDGSGEAPSTACVVSSIEGEGPMFLLLDCEPPIGVGAQVELDLDPIHPIDLEPGTSVSIEVRDCEHSIRIADERGLVFAAVDRPLDFSGVSVGAIQEVTRPLDVEVDTRACLAPKFRGMFDNELTVRDGDRVVTLFSGNAAIIEGEPRWLVVVDGLFARIPTDLEESRVDLAVLRIR